MESFTAKSSIIIFRARSTPIVSIPILKISTTSPSISNSSKMPSPYTRSPSPLMLEKLPNKNSSKIGASSMDCTGNSPPTMRTLLLLKTPSLYRMLAPNSLPKDPLRALFQLNRFINCPKLILLPSLCTTLKLYSPLFIIKAIKCTLLNLWLLPKLGLMIRTG